MTDTSFIENEERQALRKAVAALGANYGPDYYLEKARSGGHTDELWREAGELGFIGVNLPEEYGGGGAGMYELSVVPRFPEPGSVVEKGSLLAPMPGAVIRLGAALGDTVTAGQPLVWLEAMKMEHTITAPSDGVLVQLDTHVGQQVEVGAVLARVESPASAEGES